MRLKQIISAMLSTAMIFGGVMLPANAENVSADNTGIAENEGMASENSSIIEDEGVIYGDVNAEENEEVSESISEEISGNEEAASEVTSEDDAELSGEQDSSEDTAYLFAYFRRPTGGRDDERLCYGVSRDGYTFRSLNGGEPVFTSTLGTKCLRDPFIFEGEDGYFYIVVTDMDSTKGWANQSTMAIYKTKDLINIDDSILVDYKQFEGFDDCTRAWAPQVIWCPEHENADGTAGAYMVYITLMKDSTKDSIGTVLYKQFTTDLMDETKYTVPEFMITGEEEGIFAKDGAIDGDIIYDSVNSRWLMYFDGARVAVSDTVDGMYTELESGSPFVSNLRIEGSNMFKLLNEDKWIICADGQSFGTGFNVYATSDFNNYENIKSEVDYDFAPRHGYVIPINEEEYQRLIDTYGAVDYSVKGIVKNTPRDDSLFNDTTKKAAAAEHYTNKNSNTLNTDLGWTLPQDYTFDDNKYHFLGFKGDLTLGNGYGDGDDWAAITFTMVGNSGGDYAVFDCDGKGIYGDCYAPQKNKYGKPDYYFGGHGERAYDGSITDNFGVKRFSNYLKTEVTEVSEDTKTVKIDYGDNANDITCTKLIENHEGTIEDLADNVTGENGAYTGEYYTVKTYRNSDLIGIDYYSGHFNGIKTIKDLNKNYYGNLTIYSGKYENGASFTASAENTGASYGTKADGTEDKDSKATGFLMTISGEGAFDTLNWKVTSGDTTKTFNKKLETQVTLDESSSCYFGVIVNGLYDNDAVMTADVQ